MRTRCPSCGATLSLDALVAHDGAREALAAVFKLSGPLGSAVVRYLALFRICDRWPAPKVFLDNLGNRDPPKALPEPPITPEARERNRARLREIMESLAKSKQMR